MLTYGMGVKTHTLALAVTGTKYQRRDFTVSETVSDHRLMTLVHTPISLHRPL